MLMVNALDVTESYINRHSRKHPSADSELMASDYLHWRTVSSGHKTSKPTTTKTIEPPPKAILMANRTETNGQSRGQAHQNLHSNKAVCIRPE